MLASCHEERANRWKLADKFLTFFHHEINLVIGSESLNQLVTHLLGGQMNKTGQKASS
jgi:hypothetical protein